MSRPVVWFRLWRGKVWHLRDAISAQAVCGVSEPDDSEATAQTPPTRARICEACVRAARELYDAAMEGLTGDPRKVDIYGFKFSPDGFVDSEGRRPIAATDYLTAEIVTATPGEHALFDVDHADE